MEHVRPKMAEHDLQVDDSDWEIVRKDIQLTPASESLSLQKNPILTTWSANPRVASELWRDTFHKATPEEPLKVSPHRRQAIQAQAMVMALVDINHTAVRSSWTLAAIVDAIIPPDGDQCEWRP